MDDARRLGTPIPESDLMMAKTFPGIYPGIVESTTDPKILGRCRVRIPTIHDDENSTPTNSLSWARPCFPGFCFIPPQVGDSVWVMFVGGDLRYPVYMGWFPTIPLVAQSRQRHPQKVGLKYDGDIIDGEPEERVLTRVPADGDTLEAGDEPVGENLESYRTSAGLSETPPEVLKGPSWDPNIRIIKTWRGHSIIISDHPEDEYIKIVDRAGQMLFFDCAVQTQFDLNNQTPRGGSIDNMTLLGIGEADKMVHNGRTQLSIDKMRIRPDEKERASVRMTDLFGQYLEFWAEKDRAKITLQSARTKNDDQTPNHFIQISSKVDTPNEYILLKTREGHYIKLDETANDIVIVHKGGHFSIWNASNIIHAADVQNKTLVWLENLMQKFNTHVHSGVASGSSVTGLPSTQFNSGDGTTITKAG